MVYWTYIGWEINNNLIFEIFFMCTLYVKQYKIVSVSEYFYSQLLVIDHWSQSEMLIFSKCVGTEFFQFVTIIYIINTD